MKAGDFVSVKALRAAGLSRAPGLGSSPLPQAARGRWGWLGHLGRAECRIDPFGSSWAQARDARPGAPEARGWPAGGAGPGPRPLCDPPRASDSGPCNMPGPTMLPGPARPPRWLAACPWARALVTGMLPVAQEPRGAESPRRPASQEWARRSPSPARRLGLEGNDPAGDPGCRCRG